MDEINNNIDIYMDFMKMNMFSIRFEPESGSTNKLDDDCLLEIFSYLSMPDIINAEKVCQRWRRLCKQSWMALENLQCIDHEWLLTGKQRGQKLFHKGTCLNHLEKILSKHGHCIKYFYLSHNYNLKLFTITSKFCSDLSRIEIVINTPVYKEFDSNIRKLLENNTNLKTFIYYNEFDDSVLKSIFLQYMSDYTEEIILYMRHNVKPSFFISALKKFKCLRSFECRAVGGLFFDNTMIDTMNYNKSLESIFLNETKLTSSISFSHTVDLVNLTHLALRGDRQLLNFDLINVINNCKRLKFLDITQCFRITDKGIASLDKLTDLNILEMSYCNKVTDGSISNLPAALTMLTCSHCENIKDHGVINLIKSASNLRALDLSYCSITNATIQAAIEVVNERTHNFLTIKVNNTHVNPSELSNIPPLLLIN